MSKYKSEWKEFDLNKGFWNEVFVGRTIKVFGLVGPSLYKMTTGGDGTKHAFPWYLDLDSGERVWFHGTAKFPEAGKVPGRVILELTFNEKGVENIKLDGGWDIKLNPDIGGNFCIED